jgi:histidinol-phosphatase
VSTADWLPLLSEIADRSDEIARRLFRRVDLRVDEKPDRSLVTEADREIETAARKLVAERKPELGVFGEEHGEQAGSARLIIDPIGDRDSRAASRLRDAARDRARVRDRGE